MAILVFALCLYGTLDPAAANLTGLLAGLLAGGLFDLKRIDIRKKLPRNETRRCCILGYLLLGLVGLILNSLGTSLVNLGYLGSFAIALSFILVFHAYLDKQWIFRKKHQLPNWLLQVNVPLIGLFCLVALPRLIMVSGQYVHYYNGLFDDAVVLNHGLNLIEFNWLGPYSPVVLAKGMFFGSYLAVLNFFGISYLIGNQLLYFLALCTFFYSIQPLLRRRWPLVVGFLFLFYSPAVVQLQVLRVYRDSIYPYLCIFFISGVFGWYVRCQSAKKSLPYALLAGFGFTAQWLTREDGFWLLPFAAAAAVILGLTILVDHQLAWQKKLRQYLLFLVPMVMYFSVMLLVGFINLQHYQRFVVNDYMSKDFTAAYGALTRVKHENWLPNVPVPVDVREKVYQVSPAFRELQPYIETGSEAAGMFFSEVEKGVYDYDGGHFFWTLRHAAMQAGYYKNAKQAEAFYLRLADEVNAAIAAGKLESDVKQRNSLSPPFTQAYIEPTINQFFTAMTFAIKLGNELDIYYRASPEEMKESNQIAVFLHDRILYETESSSKLDESKRRPLKNIYKLYKLLLPILFYGAVVLLIASVSLFFWKHWKQKVWSQVKLFFITLSLWLCLILRMVIFAYVSVTSFNAINDLYMTTGWAFMLLTIVSTCYLFGELCATEKRQGAKQDGKRKYRANHSHAMPK